MIRLFRNASKDLTDEERSVVGRIRLLTLARLVVLPLGFGMTVAAGVMLVLAMSRLFGGNPRPLGGVIPFFAAGALMTGLAAVLIPRIDRRILDLVRSSSGRSTCIPILSLMGGLPLFSLRTAFEEELARSLAEVDEAWWIDHAKELREVVDALLEDAKRPNWMHPANGPGIPAILEAIARCGRTEYISRVEALAKSQSRNRMPSGVVEAAGSSLQSLRLRQQRDKEAATLLRPVFGSDDLLLRPLVGQPTDDTDLLLRPRSEPGEIKDDHRVGLHEPTNLTPKAEEGLPEQSTLRTS